jgi:hypothetical protein
VVAERTEGHTGLAKERHASQRALLQELDHFNNY